MSSGLRRYLADLRRELMVLFGRTEASRPVRRILDETRAHLEDTFRELREAGLSEAEAERRVIDRFGSAREVALSYHAHRAQRLRRPPVDRLERETIMRTLLRDVRFAVRGLLRSPGYTLAFVLTLGLGIGANTAIFSVVHGVLLRPLPYEDGHELVYLRHSARAAGIENVLFSVPEIDDYRRAVESFEGIAEFSAMTFTMLGLDEPRRVRAGIVTGNYFEVMGLGAAVGRLIRAEHDGPAAEPVMVLTHDFWQRAFGGDPDVVGRNVRVNGFSVAIIGVAEPAPPYPERTDIYVNMVTSPHHLDATMQTDRAHRMTEVFARLAPARTMDEAAREIELATAQLHGEFTEVYDAAAGYGVGITGLRDQLAERARPTLYLLLGAAAFVLVIACANVANLTLARALRRRHELDVRASLGAGSAALRRQLLMESLVPSLLGAVLGLVLASGVLGIMVRYTARYSARAGEIALDGTVFTVTLLVATIAAALFAFIPRLPAASGARRGRIESARVTGSMAARRLQRALVVAQVGVCFVLLIGAALLLRTVVNLDARDGGLELDAVLTMTVPATNGSRTPVELRSYYERMIERVRNLPGVRNAALGTRLPLAGVPEGLGALITSLEFRIDAEPVSPGAPPPRAELRVVTPGYFDTLGMTLVRGRLMEATDGPDAAKVVVINQAMAERFFPDRDPVGRQIAWTNELLRFIGVSNEPRTIVGVVSDSNDYGVAAAVPPIAFHPFAQEPDAAVLFVRTAEPAALERPVVAAIHELDPEQPVENIATLAQVRAGSLAPQRLNATLIGIFALLALAIASVGVAAVLAFSVGQRVRELGIRAALGARRGQLVAAVLAEGATMALAGVLIGGAVAVGVTRLIRGLLVDVEPTDPATFVGVAAVLVTVAVTAAWLPARRAARVDPVGALRGD